MVLGNDVVDLSCPHAIGKGRNLRFVKKVLTGREQAALEASGAFDRMLWMFWAAKESAYKAVSREDAKASSSPRSYEVEWFSLPTAGQAAGFISTPKGRLFVSCRLEGEAVCCLCTDTPSSKIVEGVAALPGPVASEDHGSTTRRQSQTVRRLAAGSIARATGNPFSSVKITAPHDENGASMPPEVLINGKRAGIVLSLSHDGRYLYFAWCAAGIRPTSHDFLKSALA